MANVTSIAATQNVHSLALTLSQPVGGLQAQYSTGHPTHPQPSNIYFLNAWSGDIHPFPIFQAHIHAWFETPSFAGVTDFTKILPDTEN